MGQYPEDITDSPCDITQDREGLGLSVRWGEGQKYPSRRNGTFCRPEVSLQREVHAGYGSMYDLRYLRKETTTPWSVTAPLHPTHSSQIQWVREGAYPPLEPADPETKLANTGCPGKARDTQLTPEVVN